MAITWRNVNGNTSAFDVAGRLMENAQASLRSGLGQFQGIMDDQRQLQEANRTNTISNNEADFRKYLSSLRSQGPQALEQAQASGAIDARLAGYNGLVSRDLDPTALVRENILGARSDANSEADYNLNLAKRDAAPLWERYQQAVYNNQDAEAQQIATENADLFAIAGLSGEAARILRGANQEEIGWDRESQRFDWAKYNQDRQVTADNRADDAYNAEQAAGVFLNNILASEGDLYSKRQAVREYISNPENKVPLGLANTMFTALDTRYGQQNDLTPEEVARVATIQGNAQEELGRIPIYARIDQQKLSFGDLNQKILKEKNIDTRGFWDWDEQDSDDVLQENLAQELQPAVDGIVAEMQKRKLVDENGQLIGDPMQILLEALNGTSLKDFDDGAGEIDMNKVIERASKVVDEFAPLAVRQHKELLPAIKGAETLVRRERELRRNVAKQPESNYSMPEFRIPLRQ
jgi:hypothetical protein